MKKFITRFIILYFILFLQSHELLLAQDSLQNKKLSKAAILKKNLENKNFTFLANSAMPLKGNTRQLVFGYEVTLIHDSLVVYLPYFGEAHMVPPDPFNNSLDFTSVKFDYILSVRKKGGWDILITPKDQKDTNIFSFTIFDNGSAYLNVNNTFRDPISYQGYIQEKK